MKRFAKVQLSAAGRPDFLESEIELFLVNGVTIHLDENRTEYVKGDLRVTSIRLLWSNTKGICIGLPLRDIADAVSSGGGFLGGSAKIELNLFQEQRKIVFHFKSGGRDNALAKLKEALQRRAWVIEKKKKQEFNTQSAGVAGIMRKMEKDTKHSENMIDSSFQDLDQLMAKAKELVVVAKKYTAAEARKAGGGGADAQFRSYLVSVGIASPVTRENAGSKYHEELSRQLADWLCGRPLQQSKGMMALSDLFCYFNRARGTEMVSPDDLYRACLLFETFSLPVRMRSFASGVIVVQDAKLSDEKIASDIEAHLRAKGPMSAYMYAEDKDIPVLLATEQMLQSEQLGKLCRDETLSGLVFYPNFFPFL